VLLHTEGFVTRRAAMSREWHLKRDRAFRKVLAAQVLAAQVGAAARTGRRTARAP
jgi:putative endonuclease